MNKKCLSRQTLLFLAGAVLACGIAPTLSEANAGKKDDDSPIKLGPGASLGGKRLFPDDNPWNHDISREPLDPNSDNLIASIGTDRPLHPDFGTVYQGAPSGIPYVVVDGNQKKVPVRFQYADESDPGPYPVPADAPIEGGANATGDRHVLVRLGYPLARRLQKRFARDSAAAMLQAVVQGKSPAQVKSDFSPG